MTTPPSLYEEQAKSIAELLSPRISTCRERAGEDPTFVFCVTAVYKRRGGKLDPSGSAFDDHGDPYSPEIWDEAYNDEFRRLLRRVAEILASHYGG